MEEPTLLELRWCMIEAVNVLQDETIPLEKRTQDARATLFAALCRFYDSYPEEQTASSSEPVHQIAGEFIDNEVNLAELESPARSLSDYREERKMHIPDFTDFLGILHPEYADVVHRLPVDRRVRDQIAFRLGVHWTEIAEFMPRQNQPEIPLPPIAPIPAPEGTPPPEEPWYLVERFTGKIVSGPHNEPVPLNGFYVAEPLTGECGNIIELAEPLNGIEEESLPPGGYNAEELYYVYGIGNAEDFGE